MSTRLSFRIAMLVTAGICFVAAIEAWITGLGSGSIAARGAAVLAAATGLYAGASAFLPPLVTWPLTKLGLDRLWQRLVARDESVSGGFKERTFLGLAIAMTLWGGICFAANVFGNALAPPPVELDDQGA